MVCSRLVDAEALGDRLSRGRVPGRRRVERLLAGLFADGSDSVLESRLRARLPTTGFNLLRYAILELGARLPRRCSRPAWLRVRTVTADGLAVHREDNYEEVGRDLIVVGRDGFACGSAVDPSAW